MTASGFGRPSQYCGHGIGLAVVEPPYLAEAGDEVLEPGMVLALEPWVADIDGLGIFGLGEMGVVTSDGVEMLTTIPREELWWVRADR
jgi:Xaa-Pro aminopeptidase